MAKKKTNIQIDGLDSLDLNKTPDIQSAKKIIAESTSKKRTSSQTSKKTVKSAKAQSSKRGERSNFPPPNKKRANFNIDEDLHKALKHYSFFEEIDMVEYIFEQLVRPDLIKKGYYPPKSKG